MGVHAPTHMGELVHLKGIHADGCADEAPPHQLVVISAPKYRTLYWIGITGPKFQLI